MKIPSLSCKIEMFCTINPSESIEKVEKAISNIFPYSIINNNDFLFKNGSSNDLLTKFQIYKSKSDIDLVNQKIRNKNVIVADSPNRGL